MTHIFRKALTLTLLLGIIYSTATTFGNTRTRRFSITQVKSTLVSPASTQNFNLTLKFTLPKNNFKAINIWKFGFYMPRTFNHDSTINAQMQITLSNSLQGVTHLVFVKQLNTKPLSVYGTGYSNVFRPMVQDYPLNPGQTYTLEIRNSNQWAPANLSSMPQNFFIWNANNNEFIQGTVPLSAYGATASNPQSLTGIGGYNLSKVKAAIIAHNQKHWQNSAPANAAAGGAQYQQTMQLANQYQLTPTPQSIRLINGANGTSLSNTITFSSDFGDVNLQTLQAEFKTSLHVNLLPTDKKNRANIQIDLDTDISNPEGYQLITRAPHIIIKARNSTGAFYGMQALMMLMHHSMKLPPLSIQDAPRFKYRGMLLDVARVDYPIKTIEKMITLMAAQKLNTLHIHFSDDEAWRLALPFLNAKNQELGSRGYVPGLISPPSVYTQANLDKTNYPHFNPQLNGQLLDPVYPQANTDYGHVYSNAEIQQLIHYANTRHITIIPEVDMPGHARALVHAFPNIFEDPHDKSQYISVQGYYNDVLPVCLYGATSKQAKKLTHTLNAIIQQISHLFSGQTTLYANEHEVSVGADEVSNAAWTSDSSCDRPVWQGLNALQKSQHFFSQMANQLRKNNTHIHLSGWEQLLTNPENQVSQYAIPSNEIGHTWVWSVANTIKNGNILPNGPGIHAAQALAQSNYPVVLSFADDLYFDLTYTPNAWEPGFYWAGQYIDTYSALYSAVDADAVLQGLSSQKRKAHILGIEGALWGDDYINARHMGYALLPRLSGLAEAAWAEPEYTDQDNKIDWRSLAERLGECRNSGVLGWLHNLTGLDYRGYPDGMKLALPKASCQS